MDESLFLIERRSVKEKRVGACGDDLGFGRKGKVCFSETDIDGW